MVLSRKPTAVNARRRRRLEALLRTERSLWERGFARVAGVDEAGVGPLAGPVVAAAVIFPAGEGVRGVDDSKRLEPQEREELAERVRESALAWALGCVDPEEVDRVNIYQATLEAMRRALRGLPASASPDYVLLDGRADPGLTMPHEVVIGGDASCHAIAAASILAKTARDAMMNDYDAQFPGYGFASHKGYATAAHRDAIRTLGPCAIHRRSFTLLPHPTLWEW